MDPSFLGHLAGPPVPPPLSHHPALGRDLGDTEASRVTLQQSPHSVPGGNQLSPAPGDQMATPSIETGPGRHLHKSLWEMAELLALSAHLHRPPWSPGWGGGWSPYCPHPGPCSSLTALDFSEALAGTPGSRDLQVRTPGKIRYRKLPGLPQKPAGRVLLPPPGGQC